MQAVRREDGVFVTGAAGFIGKRVVRELLARGVPVTAMTRGNASKVSEDHPLLTAVYADMTDAESLKKALSRGAKAVVHLAAAKADEKNSFDVNVDGARRLVAACKASGCRRIVNVSTQSVKIAEKGLYAATKAEADAVFAASGLDVTTLYVSLVYGEEGEGAFGSVMKAVESLPAVPVLGDGRWLSAPVYVGDVACAICACLEKNGSIGKSYDIGGPELVSLDGIIDRIALRLGRTKRKFHVPYRFALGAVKILRMLVSDFSITASNVLGSNQNVPIDIAPARRDLGFSPISMEEGLARLVKSAGEDELHAESALFSKYLVGREPSIDAAERYAQASRTLLGGRTDKALLFALKHPWSVGFLDAAAGVVEPESSILRKKIRIAAAVAETAPEESEFFMRSPEPFIKTVYYGAASAAKAALGMPIYFLAKGLS